MHHTLEQNEVTEHVNRTIIEKVRSMVSDAQLSKKYSAEAVNTEIYLKNWLPKNAVQNVTPEEAWTGEK
jgi:hypothetical protein